MSMGSSSLPLSGFIVRAWCRHFADNRERAAPCRGPPLIPSALRTPDRCAFYPAVPAWRMARAAVFMRRASATPGSCADFWFVPSLKLFIAEEQRHSAILGQFLDRERISRLAITGSTDFSPPAQAGRSGSLRGCPGYGGSTAMSFYQRSGMPPLHLCSNRFAGGFW